MVIAHKIFSIIVCIACILKLSNVETLEGRFGCEMYQFRTCLPPILIDYLKESSVDKREDISRTFLVRNDPISIIGVADNLRATQVAAETDVDVQWHPPWSRFRVHKGDFHTRKKRVENKIKKKR